MKKMTRRQEFGLPARSFEMTVSLQEGYSGGPIHHIDEVYNLIESFAVEQNIEFGCEIISSTVMYSYLSDGEMVVHKEPAVKLMGLFPPNKFGQLNDEELVRIVELLAGHLAGPLGQTSFHAEACGVHYAWKVAGEMTAHELAQMKATSK
jgi:hypothetical protein